MYIILAVLAFSLLVIVHEFGHFIAAKINGIKVLEFSIGMGPKLFSIKGKETEYLIKAFPIGGYVSMFGEEENVKDERAFSSKSPLRRISVIAAGAIMNLILALVCFGVISSQQGIVTNNIEKVNENSPASIAGIKSGDEIIKANDMKISGRSDLSIALAQSKGNPLNIEYISNGELKTTTIKPEEVKEGFFMIGVSYGVIKNPTFLQSAKNSFVELKTNVSQTFYALKSIFTGKANLKTDVGGPVTIMKLSGQFAKAGIIPLLSFVGFLSAQLAIFNLLPFPALDGGWLAILFFELITRKKAPDKFVKGLNYVGFAMLMTLMFLVTVKDILFPVKF